MNETDGLFGTLEHQSTPEEVRDHRYLLIARGKVILGEAYDEKRFERIVRALTTNPSLARALNDLAAMIVSAKDATEQKRIAEAWYTEYEKPPANS